MCPRYPIMCLRLRVSGALSIFAMSLFRNVDGFTWRCRRDNVNHVAYNFPMATPSET